MVTLAEVLTSRLADVTVLNISDVLLNSGPEFPFCFPNILHLASSLETGHNIYNPGRTAVNWSINMNNDSSNRGLDGLGVGDVGAGRAGFVAGFAAFNNPRWSQRSGEGWQFCSDQKF